MVMWIVLGGLITLVAIFLIITSIKDRKRAKEIKEKQAVREKMSLAAKWYLYIWLDEIIKANKKFLDNFIVSIGKYKMSDVKNLARSNMKKLIESREYYMASNNEKNNTVIELVKKFKKENSNNWSKKFLVEIDDIQENANKHKDEHIEFKEKITKQIVEQYDEFTK